jgi:hypothetical protein
VGIVILDCGVMGIKNLNKEVPGIRESHTIKKYRGKSSYFFINDADSSW